MTIEVLKSKISHLKVITSHINNEGVIKMTKELMEELNLINFEKVMVINENSKQTSEIKFAFVQEFYTDLSHTIHDVTTPISIAGAGDLITIMSVTRASLDEPIKAPIQINLGELAEA